MTEQILLPKDCLAEVYRRVVQVDQLVDHWQFKQKALLRLLACIFFTQLEFSFNYYESFTN